MENKLVIIGGGAGGASTAAEAKRNNPSLNVTILQSGKYASYASCPTPYFIGDIIKDANKLVARTPEKFLESGINVLLNTEVVNIDEKGCNIETKDGRKFPYDFLVFATGTNAFVPPITGKDLPGVYALRNLEDAIQIKAWLRKNNAKRVIIIGGGFSGAMVATQTGATEAPIPADAVMEFMGAHPPANRRDEG